MSDDSPLVQVTNLTFGYEPGEENQILFDLSFSLAMGTRCLLLGHNGSGKSTLLRIMSGRYVLKVPESVLVGGKRPFFDLPPGIVYVSSEVSPYHRGDCGVDRLLKSSGGDEFPKRRDKLLEVLSINPNWRMNKLSDGQRRRVLLSLALIRPPRLLLLDEATTDMDIIVRKNLFDFLYQESQSQIEREETKLTVIYCTHIFDGLGGWPSYVLHLANGSIKHSAKLNPENLPDLHKVATEYKTRIESYSSSSENSSWAYGDSILYLLVQRWLSEDAIERIEKEKSNEKTRVEVLAEKSDRYYDYWDRR